MPQILFRFVDRPKFNDFRLAELDSVLRLFGESKESRENILSQMRESWSENGNLPRGSDPFAVIDMSIELAKKVSKRMILVRSIYELWSFGSDLASLIKNLPSLDSSVIRPFLGKEHSWSFTVERFGSKISSTEQQGIRQQFVQHLPFQGVVDLKDPSQQYFYMEDYGNEPGENGEHGTTLRAAYLGRLLGVSNRAPLLQKYDLTKRTFLGPTSCDAELAFLMANQGLISPGTFATDPFVGTGSILVALAHFGAVCLGTDIDFRILKGKKGKCINSNFDQYNLVKPEIVRCDTSKKGRGIFREEAMAEILDAIVCDPPYGIRAGARKIGSSREVVKKVAEEFQDCHIPQVQAYAAIDIMNDLTEYAAKSLKVGGRLVYLLPALPDFKAEELPEHPCLRFVAMSGQSFSYCFTRFCVTFEKVCTWDDNDKEKYEAALQHNREKCASFADLHNRMEAMKAMKNGANVSSQTSLTKEEAHEITMQIKPCDMYRGQYSKLDEKGVPTHDNDGKAISKNQRKKLIKRMLKHEYKYNAYHFGTELKKRKRNKKKQKK
eukprot:g1432.t1